MVVNVSCSPETGIEIGSEWVPINVSKLWTFGCVNQDLSIYTEAE